jgi:hypothetical protein
VTIAEFARKASLFVRIWAWFIVVNVLLRLRPLPSIVRQLSRTPNPNRSPIPPIRLGRAVSRSLSLLGYQPRCLTLALVLYRLLGEQGDSPELVVGLPRRAMDETAHAWVEIGGMDVGPPPGKQGHEELVRYGAPGSEALRSPGS